MCPTLAVFSRQRRQTRKCNPPSAIINASPITVPIKSRRRHILQKHPGAPRQDVRWATINVNSTCYRRDARERTLISLSFLFFFFLPHLTCFSSTSAETCRKGNVPTSFYGPDVHRKQIRATALRRSTACSFSQQHIYITRAKPFHISDLQHRWKKLSLSTA